YVLPPAPTAVRASGAPAGIPQGASGVARRGAAVPRGFVAFERVWHFPPLKASPTAPLRLAGYATLEVDTAPPLSEPARVGVDLDAGEQLFRLLIDGSVRVRQGGLWSLRYSTDQGEDGPRRVLHQDRIELAETPPPLSRSAVYHAETLDDGWFRATSDGPQYGQTDVYVRVADHAIRHVTPCWAMAHRGLFVAYRSRCRE